MAEDRKRTYQSTTSLPGLRTKIGVPPLKMVLVGGEAELPASEAETPERPGEADGTASKERVVRKIIAHLQKES